MDWKKVINAESSKELREAKLWLFQENMRLEQVRQQLEQGRTSLEREQKNLKDATEKFLRERTSFKDEMNLLNRRSVQERKRLKEENLFFEKKMAILQDGFRQLEADRKALERERISFEKERESRSQRSADSFYGDPVPFVAEILFRNATNPLALRKRYKDLMKIFHPDNIAGDEELVQMINREFARRRREEA